jgi:hypothetical protein
MDDGGVCLTCGPGDEDKPEDAESKDKNEDREEEGSKKSRENNSEE